MVSVPRRLSGERTGGFTGGDHRTKRHGSARSTRGQARRGADGSRSSLRESWCNSSRGPVARGIGRRSSSRALVYGGPVRQDPQHDHHRRRRRLGVRGHLDRRQPAVRPGPRSLATVQHAPVRHARGPAGDRAARQRPHHRLRTVACGRGCSARSPAVSRSAPSASCSLRPTTPQRRRIISIGGFGAIGVAIGLSSVRSTNPASTGHDARLHGAGRAGRGRAQLAPKQPAERRRRRCGHRLGPRLLGRRRRR